MTPPLLPSGGPIRALARAAGDMLRPALLGLVARAIGLALALLLALGAAAAVLVRALAPATLHLPVLGEVPLRAIAGWGTVALIPVLAFLLMAPVAAAIGGLMGDTVAARVERIHYPASAGRAQGPGSGIGDALAVMLATLAVAVASLVLTPVLGPLAPIPFYAANGWLLGRELFAAAALRHLPRPQALALRRAASGRIAVTGAAVSLLLTLPVVSLLVPVLAMAAFTHLFHLTAGSAGPRSGHPRG